MKKFSALLLLFLTIGSYSQNNTAIEFGKLLKDDFDLKTYELDTTANAIVLDESGTTIFEIKYDNIIISTKYYFKIKVLKKEGFKHGTFEIPLYNNKSDKERVEDIKAITHNKFRQNKLLPSDIFEERVNEYWTNIKFTMPNLAIGSIIEVQYTVESPFKFNLTGWEFQSDIPKLKSSYKATIPGNYVYNRSLKGYLKLVTNSSKVKKKCFRVPRYIGEADCEVVDYSMTNIPAFIEEEYLTSKKNYLARIKFELSEFKWFDGSTKKYTTTWEAVDREMRRDKEIGGQLKKIKFFKDQLPENIKNETNKLNKAKLVYNFIQNHYTWNEKYSIFKDVNVKDAFDSKIGNVGEINISLTNALNAAGLKTELVLLSTRLNGLPTKIHPVISDFNYVIAKVNINDTYYFLDATNKLIPFGLLPFKCLNRYGRVMDFENDSYWIDIELKEDSKTQTIVALKLNDDNTLTGKIRHTFSNYHALQRREVIQNKSEENIMDEFENNFNSIEVLNYSIKNKSEIDMSLIENYDIKFNNSIDMNQHIINPFFANQIKQNPFKQNEREYPVNFGYLKNYTTNFILDFPDSYEIDVLPENKNIALINNGGNLSFLIDQPNTTKLILKNTFTIEKSNFYSKEYNGLKEFFNQLIKIENSPIILKKKEL